VPRSARGGLTLLEILLALAIFFGSLVVLSQLAWNGSRAAVQARLKTQAIIRCEAKLAEVLAGAETLQPKTRVPFPDNSAWTWSLTISETVYPDLLQLDVTVSHGGKSKLSNVEFTLRRWMRDPSLFMDAAMQKKESQSINGTSSSTTTK
jgi:type II secretory pathway pseudopilin PulG